MNRKQLLQWCLHLAVMRGVVSSSNPEC